MGPLIFHPVWIRPPPCHQERAHLRTCCPINGKFSHRMDTIGKIKADIQRCIEVPKGTFIKRREGLAPAPLMHRVINPGIALRATQTCRMPQSREVRPPTRRYLQFLPMFNRMLRTSTEAPMARHSHPGGRFHLLSKFLIRIPLTIMAPRILLTTDMMRRADRNMDSNGSTNKAGTRCPLRLILRHQRTSP